jgi:predicted acetyltransferase
MTTTLHVAQSSDAPLLENLLQFYYYDFCELLGGHVGMDGKFAPPPLDAYWRDAWRYPRLIRVDEHPAGFALVQRGSRLNEAPDTWDVCEFFVMRQYRRQGVGALAALGVFEEFRGRWEVRQMLKNSGATQFWRAVIARHTGGEYNETVHDDERWRGPVQTFDNTLRASDADRRDTALKR